MKNHITVIVHIITVKAFLMKAMMKVLVVLALVAASLAQDVTDDGTIFYPGTFLLDKDGKANKADTPRKTFQVQITTDKDITDMVLDLMQQMIDNHVMNADGVNGIMAAFTDFQLRLAKSTGNKPYWGANSIVVDKKQVKKWFESRTGKAPQPITPGQVAKADDITLGDDAAGEKFTDRLESLLKERPRQDDRRRFARNHFQVKLAEMVSELLFEKQILKEDKTEIEKFAKPIGKCLKLYHYNCILPCYILF